MTELNSPCASLAQVLQFSQADVDKLLKEKESELLAKEREMKSKLDDQKRKCAELSTEKLQSDEKVLRLQKSHEDMKYVGGRLSFILDHCELSSCCDFYCI